MFRTSRRARWNDGALELLAGAIGATLDRRSRQGPSANEVFLETGSALKTESVSKAK